MDRKFLWAAFFLTLIGSVFVARAVIFDMRDQASSMDAEMAKSPLGELWFKSLELEKEASKNLKASNPAGAVAALDAALANIAKIKAENPNFFPQWVEERGNSLKELRLLIELVKAIPANGETEVTPYASAKKLPNQPEREPLNLKPPTSALNDRISSEPVPEVSTKKPAGTVKSKEESMKRTQPENTSPPNNHGAVKTPPVAPVAVKAPPVAPTAVKPPPVAPVAVKSPPVAPTAVKPPPVASAAVKPPPVAPVAVKPPPVAPVPVKPTPVAPAVVKTPPVAPAPVKPPPVAEVVFKMEDPGSDPSSIWYRAWNAAKAADTFKAQGKLEMAADKYQESKICYEILNRDFPDFQSQHIKSGPGLLDKKLKQIGSKK